MCPCTSMHSSPVNLSEKGICENSMIWPFLGKKLASNWPKPVHKRLRENF